VEDFGRMLEFERQVHESAWREPERPAMQNPAGRYQQTAADSPADADDLESAERSIIARCLEKNRGNISATAKELGMARNTLYQRIKKYGL